MAAASDADFSGPVIEPDPENPGWLRWRYGERDRDRFNEAVMGPLLIRSESDGKVRLRMSPKMHHTNPWDAVHGGVIMALTDIALFAGWRMKTKGEVRGAVTLELSNQFIGPGNPALPLDALSEVMRETGRLVFLRGEVVQEEHIVASFSGIVRKAV